jgi:hypothetical protein
VGVLAQQRNHAVQDGNRYDNNADKWLVCVLHKPGIDYSVNEEGVANSMRVERSFSGPKLSLLQR